IIAHKNYRHTFDSERHRSESERAHFAEPSILVSDEMSIRWGRYNLDIFYNPGHTMSTLGVDIPEADLLFVGDTIVGNIVYFSYSTPQMFFTALDRLKRGRRRRIISSHMGARSSQAISDARHYLNCLQEKVSAIRENTRDEELILKIDLGNCLAPGLAG